jgi:putative ABC transport system substrate-binding protein
MPSLIRHLAAPTLLIAALSALLLSLDRIENRKPSPGAASLVRLAIAQTSSNPVMDDSVRGILKTLADRGFREGQNLEVSRFTPENDISTGNTIGTQMANGNYDLLVTCGTQMLQAVANANRGPKKRHIFTLVTDPVTAGVGVQREPLAHPDYMVGYSTKEPVKRALEVLKAANPGARRIGAAYNAGEVNATIVMEDARKFSKELGLELIEVSVDNTSGVAEAIASLISRDIDALFAGADVTVFTAMPTVLDVTRRAGIGVISVNPGHIGDGVLIEVGADYYQVGEITGKLVADVLQGQSIREVEWKNMVPEVVTINPAAASGLKGQWNFKHPSLAQAIVYQPTPAPNSPAPPAPPAPPAAEPATEPAGPDQR